MNKKGAAMEMAIIVMLVIFAFCSLIFAANIRESVRDGGLNSKMGVPQELEQLGEDFYSEVINKYKSGYSGNELLENITLDDVYYEDVLVTKKTEYSSDHNFDYYGLELHSIIEDEGNDILILKVTVSYDLSAETFKIIEWYFNNPLNDTDFITEIEKEYE